MSDSQETTAEAVAEPKPVYEWTVLKRDPNADSAFVGAVWVEVGTINSQYGSILGGNIPRLLGELQGAGEYLCIRGTSAYRVSVTGHTVWEYEQESAEEPS